MLLLQLLLQLLQLLFVPLQFPLRSIQVVQELALRKLPQRHLLLQLAHKPLRLFLLPLLLLLLLLLLRLMLLPPLLLLLLLLFLLLFLLLSKSFLKKGVLLLQLSVLLAQALYRLPVMDCPRLR